MKAALSLNIEEASPAHFIPLPRGYEQRAVFLGRYGRLEVFHFDPYSMALSKIERGTAEDFSDVLALLGEGRLEMVELRQAFQGIPPRVPAESLKADPVEFERKFQALEDMWREREAARPAQDATDEPAD